MDYRRIFEALLHSKASKDITIYIENSILSDESIELLAETVEKNYHIAELSLIFSKLSIDSLRRLKMAIIKRALLDRPIVVRHKMLDQIDYENAFLYSRENRNLNPNREKFMGKFINCLGSNIEKLVRIDGEFISNEDNSLENLNDELLMKLLPKPFIRESFKMCICSDWLKVQFDDHIPIICKNLKLNPGSIPINKNIILKSILSVDSTASYENFDYERISSFNSNNIKYSNDNEL